MLRQLLVPSPVTANSGLPIAVTLAGFTIENGIDIATHPETCELWGVLKTEDTTPGNRVLVTINPLNGDAMLVGQPGIAVASIGLVPEPTSLLLGIGRLALLLRIRPTTG